MDVLDIHYKYDYKGRLLYMLLLNYYRKYYSDNRFNGKVVVACSTTSRLMKDYDIFYNTINLLTVSDIIKLNNFTYFYDKQLKLLFKKLREKNVSYDKLIKGIKEEYTKDKSLYYDDLCDNHHNLPSDKNVIFVEVNNLVQIYSKYLIRDIFIPEKQYVSQLERQHGGLYFVLSEYVEEFIKMINILKAHTNIQDDFLKLNLFIDTDKGIDIIDKVNSRTRDEEDEE